MNDFKTYCSNQGVKPSHYTVLKKYVDDLKSGEIVKCDCCGEMTHTEFMHTARYNRDVEVCEQCRKDGN